MFQHKEDAMVFPRDLPLEEILKHTTIHKDKMSREGGWEFCSQMHVIQPPAMHGGVGTISVVMTFVRPVDPTECTEFQPPAADK